MQALKEYLSDDQLLELIIMVDDGRALEAAKMLQYDFIEIWPITLPQAVLLVQKLHADFFAQ